MGVFKLLLLLCRVWAWAASIAHTQGDGGFEELVARQGGKVTHMGGPGRLPTLTKQPICGICSRELTLRSGLANTASIDNLSSNPSHARPENHVVESCHLVCRVRICNGGTG